MGGIRENDNDSSPYEIYFSEIVYSSKTIGGQSDDRRP